MHFVFVFLVASGASAECDVFRFFPERVRLFKGSAPYTVLNYWNDCMTPLRVKATGDRSVRFAEDHVYVPAKSTYRQQLSCTKVGTTVASFSATSGDSTSVAITCEQGVVEVVGNTAFASGGRRTESSFHVRRVGAVKIEDITTRWQPYPFAVVEGGYMVEACETARPNRWRSWDSWDEEFRKWYCELHSSYGYPCEDCERRCQIQTDCKFDDIRLIANYEKVMTSRDDGPRFVDYDFPFLSGKVYPQVALSRRPAVIPMDLFTNPQPPKPALPNLDTNNVIAALWGEEFLAEEVGYVRRGEDLVVQWTDVSSATSVGKVSLQIVLKSSGNVEMRTGGCWGDTSFLSTSVTGYQATDPSGKTMMFAVPFGDVCRMSLHFELMYRIYYQPAAGGEVLVTTAVEDFDPYAEVHVAIRSEGRLSPAPQGQVVITHRGQDVQGMQFAVMGH